MVYTCALTQPNFTTNKSIYSVHKAMCVLFGVASYCSYIYGEIKNKGYVQSRIKS